MHLKNILLVVEDIELSVKFYKELFGLWIVNDFDVNVILTEGLVLQDRKIWEKLIQHSGSYNSHDAELYFVENDIDGFVNKLKNCSFEIEYLNPLIEHDWGQRVVRIYDPDHHVIEVGEDRDYVVKRFLKKGMTTEEVAHKTQMPIDYVKMLSEH